MNHSLCNLIAESIDDNSTDKEQSLTLHTFVYEVLSVYIVIFGLISNSILLIVLTRKNLISNPSNVFLIGISFADLLVMTTHISIFLVTLLTIEHSYMLTLWTILLMPPCYITCSIGTWITVCLAGWRVIALYFPFQRRLKLSVKNASIIVICVYVMVTTVMGWHYFWYYISAIDCFSNHSNVLYRNIEVYNIEHSHRTIQKIGFLIKPIGMQIIPCILLLIFTIMLLIKLSEAKDRRSKLTRSTMISTPSISGRETHNGKASMMKKASDTPKGIERSQSRERESKSVIQTSNVLIVIFILSLICELPTAITIIIDLIADNMTVEIHFNLIYQCNIFRLFNCSLNLVLYCIMSSVFRSTFMNIFGRYIPFCGSRDQSSSSEGSSAFSTTLSKYTDSNEMSIASKIDYKHNFY